MKVILTKKLASFGEIGDVVEVKNGYARNFLIPKNRAIYFSDQNYKFFKDQKEKFESENQEAVKIANENKAKINNKTLIIIESASDDGRLYGSISTTLVANRVNELFSDKDNNISKSNVIISKSVKEIGKYNIKVELYSEIEADITLIIARSEDEAAKIQNEDSLPKKDEKNLDDHGQLSENIAETPKDQEPEAEKESGE